MNNRCKFYFPSVVVVLQLFCQLLREPNEHLNDGLHVTHKNYVTSDLREMVLVTFDGTWTLSLCSLYILNNMILVKALDDDIKKEALFVSDDKVFQRNYRLEDFFWTGSGDAPYIQNIFSNDSELEIGMVETSPYETWRTTTVFHTTTILFATVYPDAKGCSEFDCIPHISPVQTESTDLSLPYFPSSNIPGISPSPSLKPSSPSETKASHVFVEKQWTKVNEEETATSSSTVKKYTNTSNETVFPKTKLEETETTVFPNFHLDENYWLLTVMRNDSYSPSLELNSIEQKLSNLYGRAFNRQQEKFLRGTDFRERKDRKLSQSVKAQIVNVTRIGYDIGIIYLVMVGGKPIPAITAANDMKLLATSEVVAELGRPILTKAEPYVKNTVPLGARVRGRTRDTWLLIGCVIAAVFLLIILAGLFVLILSKKKKKKSARANGNRQQVFKEEEGRSNLAFEDDSEFGGKRIAKRTHRSHFKEGESKVARESTGTIVKFLEEEKRESTTSSNCSGSSEASLVRLRHQQRKRERKRDEKDEKPKPKPRTRNGSRRGCILSASSMMSTNTIEDSNGEEYSSHLTRSPTSYLSMPSVKAFPRGTKIPDPLNKVLEPTSIRHLDADSDSACEYSQHLEHRQVEVSVEQVCETRNKKKTMTRHASLEGEDPGFIGPVVWNRHCQKISEREMDIQNVDSDDNVNVGRLRKRFNELLDDALSLFGSREGSPEGSDIVPVRQPDNRVHSAIVRPVGLEVDETTSSRPKTTGSKRPQTSLITKPRGAWETPSCSTLVRPISTGVFKCTSPKIDKNLIYVNSDLTPSDPAIPLIAAIKDELKKFDDSSGNNKV